ncbi:hypothetical protein [Umezawaea sp. NPDC059074]|uniref:hypothetical protein n=1 Tax=Umezawaea sp. NPDC059074 TaxID=3346716 RepID=UPI0036ADD6DA
MPDRETSNSIENTVVHGAITQIGTAYFTPAPPEPRDPWIVLALDSEIRPSWSSSCSCTASTTSARPPNTPT